MAVLCVILLTLHLLAMNVASVGPLVAIWLHARGRKNAGLAWETGRRLASLSLGCLLLGFFLGFVQLGLSWTGVYAGNWDAVVRISSREMRFVIAEFVFSVVCLTVYVVCWNRWRGRPWMHSCFAILGTTNLLYHFPPLMAALGELSVRPELASEPILTHAVLRSVILRPEVLSLSVHFIVASAAVTGVVLMHLAQRHSNNGKNSDQATRLIVAGAWIALVASLAQLGIGTWVLMALPARARNGLIGDDWLATSLFVVSILGAFGILHALASIALGNLTRAAIRRGTLLMLAVIFLMTGTLARSRQLSASRVSTFVQDKEELR